MMLHVTCETMINKHVTHPICSNPRISPVQKSSGLSSVVRNQPPQDSKSWLVHQPTLSPESPQESSGILQKSVGDNKDLGSGMDNLVDCSSSSFIHC